MDKVLDTLYRVVIRCVKSHRLREELIGKGTGLLERWRKEADSDPIGLLMEVSEYLGEVIRALDEVDGRRGGYILNIFKKLISFFNFLKPLLYYLSNQIRNRNPLFLSKPGQLIFYVIGHTRGYLIATRASANGQGRSPLVG